MPAALRCRNASCGCCGCEGRGGAPGCGGVRVVAPDAGLRVRDAVSVVRLSSGPCAARCGEKMCMRGVAKGCGCGTES